MTPLQKKKSPNLPYGYRDSSEPGYIEPIPEIQEKLEQAIGWVEDLSMSVRKAAEWLSITTGKSISYEGLRKLIVKRKQEELAAPAPKQEVLPSPPDWETHPERYVTDEKGEFILTLKGRPKKKAGKPKGSTVNYHSETKAKLAVRASIRERKRAVEKTENRLRAQRASLKAKKEVANKLDVGDGVGKKSSTIVSESDLDLLPAVARREIEQGESKIAFRPHPGPQEDFLAADEKDVLYGGAAGGRVKSFYCLLSAQAVKIKIVNCWKLLIP